MNKNPKQPLIAIVIFEIIPRKKFKASAGQYRLKFFKYFFNTYKFIYKNNFIIKTLIRILFLSNKLKLHLAFLI